MTKETLRKEAKRVLAAITPEERERRSKQIETNVLQFLSSLHTPATPLSVVGLFLPLPGEPLWNFARWATFPWRLAFPVGHEGAPAFHLPSGALPTEGPWLGAGGEKTAPDILIVPGLAFTEDGWRLGRGGGWYDRLLASGSPPRGRIGVGFEEQVRGGWEAEAHDQKMDVIVTDLRVRHCPRGVTA